MQIILNIFSVYFIVSIMVGLVTLPYTLNIIYLYNSSLLSYLWKEEEEINLMGKLILTIFLFPIIIICNILYNLIIFTIFLFTWKPKKIRGRASKKFKKFFEKLDKVKNFWYNIYMKNKKLEKIASEIIELENACQQSDNISENMSELKNIASGLKFMNF